MRLIQAQKQEVRARLLETGMQLFDQQGFYSTTVEQITQATGVAKGTFYNYFTSKEDLALAGFEAVVSQVSNTMRDAQDRPRSAQDALANLYGAFGQITSPRPELIWIWCTENVKRGFAEPGAVMFQQLLKNAVLPMPDRQSKTAFASQRADDLAVDLLGLTIAQVVDWYHQGANQDLGNRLIQAMQRYLKGFTSEGS